VSTPLALGHLTAPHQLQRLSIRGAHQCSSENSCDDQARHAAGPPSPPQSGVSRSPPPRNPRCRGWIVSSVRSIPIYPARPEHPPTKIWWLARIEPEAGAKTLRSALTYHGQNAHWTLGGSPDHSSSDNDERAGHWQCCQPR
jgi:hypothetical protein